MFKVRAATSDKFDGFIVDGDGRNSLLVFNEKILMGGRKYHEFGFFRGKSDMMGRAVVKG